MDIFVIFIIGAFIIGLGLGYVLLIYERHKKGKEELEQRIKARQREEYMSNPDNFRVVDRTPEIIKCGTYEVPFLQLDQFDWTTYAGRFPDTTSKVWNPEYIVIPSLLSREDILKWVNSLHRIEPEPSKTKESQWAETFKNCKNTLRGEA